MGTASHVLDNKEWDLGEIIGHIDQKFATDMKPLATETTNDKSITTGNTGMFRKKNSRTNPRRTTTEFCRSTEKQIPSRF